MATKIFTVAQIHCRACATAIRKSLGRVDGVQRVEPDPATNTVFVAFDENQIAAEQVAARLNSAGFPVLD